LHRDNAPAHTALSIQQFLAKNKMVVVAQSLWLLSVVSNDFIHILNNTLVTGGVGRPE
jgi:hypothetical protein